MADDDRPAPRAVAFSQALTNAAWDFDFFQALRRIECEHRERPRVGKAQRPQDESIRLGQEPSLAHAGAALARFLPGGEFAPRLLVHFFGMLGPNGALPLHLTDYVRQRLHHNNDPTFARFLDLFHHRMLSLFYRAWADAQPAVHRDRPEHDRFMTYLGAPAGFGMPSMRARDELPDRAKLYYAGRFACQSRHPEGLEAMISDYFQMPARIEQFVGEWITIPPGEGWRLGRAPGRAQKMIGKNAMLGARVWVRQHKFRVVLGPLQRSQFRRMLPDGKSLPRLRAMVRNYIGEELAWDLRLVLKSEALHPFKLGIGSQLGRTSWLVKETAQTGEWEDLIFDPQQPERGMRRNRADATKGPDHV